MSELYHGTRAGFRGKGGLVLPATQTRRKENWNLGRSDRVYVTPERALAAYFARASQGRGVPKILTVKPVGPLYRDDSTVEGEEHESYAVEAAYVLRVEILG